MIAHHCCCGHSHCPYCGHAVPDPYPHYPSYPWQPWKYVQPYVWPYYPPVRPYWGWTEPNTTITCTTTISAHDPVRAAVTALAG